MSLSMLANSTVLLVRHGEKPGDPCEDGDGASGLSPAGQARAQAYAAYFQNYVAEALDGSGSKPVALDHLFAAKDSHASQRPRLTLEPLSAAIGHKIHDDVADADWADLVTELADYQGVDLLICWHHGTILDLANALLDNGNLEPGGLLPASAWPETWPCWVFGWLLQIVYDSDGNADPAWVRAISEQLMYDDTVDPSLGV